MKPLYTPEEFADEMRRIVANNIDDAENRHCALDDTMTELLISLGYEEGVEIFWDTTKYYG